MFASWFVQERAAQSAVDDPDTYRDLIVLNITLIFVALLLSTKNNNKKLF